VRTDTVAPVAGPARNTIETAIRDALATQPPPPENLDPTAVAKTNEVTQQLTSKPFQTGRFFGALTIFIALVVAGIITDAFELSNSPGALYGFAGTVFGIVTAFISSEKASDS
jgi:hypothetical protein